MYEKKDWTEKDSFAVLSMMQEFTDAELKELGMDAATITKYREYVAKQSK